MDQKLENYSVATAKVLPGSSLADLPSELLIQIFSYLDPFTLDNTIGNVCRNWNYIINNNELWKETFKKRFGTVNFASLSRTKIWRNEYILRDQLLKKWTKGSSIHKNYHIQNLILTDLSTDFANDKLVVFSSANGIVNVANLTNGKNAATIPVLSPSETTVYKLTKSCIVFGRYDGKIYGKLLSSKSYLSEIIQFQGGTHRDWVTAIDCVDNISGKDETVGCISGDAKGNLYLWDLKNTKLMQSIKVAEGPIADIKSNYKDLIVVQGVDYVTIINKNLTEPSSPAYKAQTFESKSDTGEAADIAVDFAAKQVVLTNAHKISVYSYDSGSFGSVKSYTTKDEIVKVAIGGNRQREIDHKIVGHDGCMMAVALRSSKVLIFNIRLNTLVPVTTIQPVFKNEIPTNGSAIRSIAISPLVVLIGTYNGYCYLYNALTGSHMRNASIRIPRRLLPIEYNIAVECVALNQDNYITNGVIVCGNVIQYFQFGDLNSIAEKKKPKRGTALRDRKFAIKRGIKSELDDMSYEKTVDDARNELVKKYNGDQYDEEEEFQMALALSQSMDSGSVPPPADNDDDKELARALELSTQDINTLQNLDLEADEGSSNRYEEDDFERAIRLSLREH